MLKLAFLYLYSYIINSVILFVLLKYSVQIDEIDLGSRSIRTCILIYHFLRDIYLQGGRLKTEGWTTAISITKLILFYFQLFFKKYVMLRSLLN